VGVNPNHFAACFFFPLSASLWPVLAELMAPYELVVGDYVSIWDESSFQALTLSRDGRLWLQVFEGEDEFASWAADLTSADMEKAEMSEHLLPDSPGARVQVASILVNLQDDPLFTSLWGVELAVP